MWVVFLSKIMAAYNGTRRKLTEGLMMYVNELSNKSYPGEPTTNFIETAYKDSKFDVHTGHDFYRIYRDEDPNQQGMYKSLAPGYMKDTDVVYKSNFPKESYTTTLGKHGFQSIYLDIGSEYTLSVDVFVSKGHQRTGVSNRAVIQASPLNQASQYGTYDFSRKGTWQTVSILIKPSLLTGTEATSGTGGSAGSSGTSGVSGVIQTSIYYSVYMYPRVNYPYQTSQSGNALHGYILYKNFQLEKNKLEYAGSVHRTQFLQGRPGKSSYYVPHSTRLASSGLVDLSGNNNSFNIGTANFDSDARPVFSSRGNYGSYYNLGITSTKSGSSSFLSLGNSNKKTYDFWVNLDSVSNEYSTLFYSDITQSGSFTADDDISKKQHIYVYSGRVYCDFYNSSGLSTSCFTGNEVLNAGSVYNISVVVDTDLANKKIKIYVNGYIKNVTIVDNIKAPSSFVLKVFNLEEGANLFKKGQTANYAISSYDEKGESIANVFKSILIKNNFSIVNLTWSNVPAALGFSVYRSLNPLGKFDENSLLTKVTNSYFGGDTTDSITFSDDNSITPTKGLPKDVSDYNKYSLINTDFYDGSDLKATIGAFPRLGEASNKNYSEGKIYKTSIYKKALNSKQILHNYIQGSEDFSLASVNYSFSASANTSSGGY